MRGHRQDGSGQRMGWFRVAAASVLLTLAVIVLGTVAKYATGTATIPVAAASVPGSAPASPAPSTPASIAPSAQVNEAAALVKTATETATKSAAGTLAPVTVEAEDGTVRKGADIVFCTGCSGGQRVTYLGQLDIEVRIPKAGKRTITVVYEADHESVIEMKVAGTRLAYRKVTGDDRNEQQTVTFTAKLPAGNVTLSFYAYEGDPADLDRFTIS
ncbi:hypothetical protein [Actinoplanes sp. NPDC051851]|uniref:hypothetical protein n=1 Tax=Actinoplanes sp. NPDC051851 TaxID=3154753 RepID=UPI003433BCE3